MGVEDSDHQKPRSGAGCVVRPAREPLPIRTTARADQLRRDEDQPLGGPHAGAQ